MFFKLGQILFVAISCAFANFIVSLSVRSESLLTLSDNTIIIPLLCGGIPERPKGADCKSAA